MTPVPETRLVPPFPPYDATTRRAKARAMLARPLGWKELGLGVLAILAALGWTITSPGRRLDKLDTRMARTESRVDTLFDQQRFTNYLLCVQIRRTDPLAVPPDCAPIIESRKGR